MDRRTALGLIGLGTATAFAKPALADTVVQGDGVLPGDPKDVITLWPGTPPGGRSVSLPPIRVTNHEPPYITPSDRAIDQVGIPIMNVFPAARPDGSAMILAPGGGYAREMLDFEGMDVARHFNAAGVTCFVLRYRLPAEGWQNRADVPLQDAQRAMRLVRANAGKYGIDPARIGFMGFSAGGHVACSVATRFAAKVYAPVDDADKADARPSFSVPMYPVVTMGAGAHQGSRDRLIGLDPSPELVDAYSCEKHVPADAPPSFLALAADDTTVPPMPNAGAYFAALQAAKIPSEMHMFEAGGHGFGIARTAGRPTSAWPNLLLQWGTSHGFFKAAG
ncbi:MAG TPA: alpha/beta hydrolase [Rhizomicrobium sp.]|nr:alpha/beta hydrolase [Rhizomicrobium sp.]